MLKPFWVPAFAMCLIGAVAPNSAYCADDRRDSLDNELIEAPNPVRVPDVLQPAAADNNTCPYAAGTDSRDCTVGLGH